MLDRDEHRAKCIEAIGIALCRLCVYITFEQATEVFDSLHGIARVDPVEATDAMIFGARAARQAHKDLSLPACLDDVIWRAMSSVGDLTNPPETKP